MAGVTAPRLSSSQSRLVEVVNRLSKGLPRIPAGPNERGLLGLQLDLRPTSFTHLFSNDGIDVSREVKDFQHRLQTNEAFRLQIQAGIPGYDIRIQDAEEAFWVLVGQAFAKSVVDKTGKRDGHVFHLGHDVFHVRHNRVVSILAMTLIKSGVCDNGGGIIYWGIQDGGTMKHMPMLQHAQAGEAVHWGNATISHKTQSGLAGLKSGMSGRVNCADDLMSSIFEVMVKGDYLSLKRVDQPKDLVLNVGDTNPFFTGVARRSIQARTTMPESTPLDHNPLIARIAEIVRALGAQIIMDKEDIGEPSKVRDPNETGSPAVQELIQMGADLYIDPDGDRLGGTSDGTNIKGTDLLFLAAHNLATYNPSGKRVAVVSDMRASVSSGILGKNLTSAGYPIEVIPAAPGYNMFHEAIERGLRKGKEVAFGIEETSHTMWRPYTSTLFGAPVDLIDQGGDNALLFGIVFLLGLRKWMWEGRNPAQQLAYVLSQFNVPATVRTELKPMISAEQGMAKVAVAQEIKNIARLSFAGNPNVSVEEFDTGALISFPRMNAAVLIRHSKSGSGFTISGEFIKGDTQAEVLTRNLGVAVMLEAVKRARITMGSSNHPLHSLKDFQFLPKDIEPIAQTLGDPSQVIAQAASLV